MSVFSWISSLFEPVSSLVDEIHFSGEEKGAIDVKKAELRNKLSEIEAKVATRTLDLQSQIIDANAKIATAEQEHGNWYVKSVRPTVFLCSFIMLTLMGFDIIPFNKFLASVFGATIGYYPLRSWEKKK